MAGSPITRNLPERLCYTRPGDDMPPGINLVGRFRCRGATLLPRHAHEGVYELCLVAHGMMRYRYEEHEVDIGAGELHLCRPGVMHAGVNNLLDPCLLYWCEFNPETLLPAGESRDFYLRHPSGRMVCDAPDSLCDVFEAMLEACGRPRSVERDTEVQWRLGVMLMELAHAGGNAVSCGRRFSRPVANLIRAFREDPAGRRQLSELVAASGLGASALHERFRRETGFSPHEYRVLQKIERARELLSSTGASITEIACTCGFSSSQYFATVFGRITGFTPGRWRHLHSGEAAPEPRETPGTTSGREKPGGGV